MKKIKIYRNYKPRILNNETYHSIMFYLFSETYMSFEIFPEFCNQLNILKREKN